MRNPSIVSAFVIAFVIALVASGCGQSRPIGKKPAKPAKPKAVAEAPAPVVADADTGWPSIEDPAKLELKLDSAAKASADGARDEAKPATETPASAAGSGKNEAPPAAPAPGTITIDFEGGHNYSSGAGQVVEKAPISGKKSLSASSYGMASDWYEFLRTENGALKPGFKYSVTLKYRVKQAAPGAMLYMLFRSSGKGYSSWDRGWKQADNIGASAGTVRTIATSSGLDNRYDYQLILGLHGEAELTVDDVVVTTEGEFHEESAEKSFRSKIPAEAKRIALLDFEDEASSGLDGSMGSIVRENALAGRVSIKGDSTMKDSMWNTFYSSKPGYFKPDNYYYVMLKYNVLTSDKDTQFYVLVRSPKGMQYDVILKTWQAPAGAIGEFSFQSGVYFPYDDYTLSVCVMNKGAVIIDDIEIYEVDRPENVALKNRGRFDTTKAKLVWEETFDGATLDRERWKVEGDQPRRGGMWRDANCYVDGKGNFVLRFDKEHGTYNGGCIASKKKFRFGYFEARIKLNDYAGHWLGFWLVDGAVGSVGDDGRDGTEIDIVEAPWRGTDTVSHALHWDGYGDAHRSTGQHAPAPGLEEGWHTFAVDWFEHGYVFYVDGKETWRTYAGEVCQVPLSILVSDELGGWSGQPVDDKLPDHCYVDWIRVYEEAE